MGSEIVVSEGMGVTVREQSGMLAMATMSEGEFGVRLAALKQGQARIKLIKQELMEEGAHYGVIPGTKKPTLLKPGAEVLCSIYGLRPDFIPTLEAGDGVTTPTLRVTMRCELHLGDIAGPVVAVGYGSANSWERKHRYRRGERACPACGVVGQVIKGKAEYGGGWLCWQKKGGCGAKFDDGDPAIEQQQIGDVANPDPYDLENTLVKMAKKRAHIDAALTGTASSDLFTQDLEEQGPGEKEHAGHRAEPEPAHEDGPPNREPGEDDEERAAYSKHDVEPPARKATPAAPRPAPSGDKVPCPHCGKPAGPSKFPKAGAEMFCGSCKKGFPA